MSDTARTALARSNIQAALSYRGKSSFEASTALGRNRTYLDDFLKGRKESIAATFKNNLADLLDLHSSYFDGIRTWEETSLLPARGTEATLAHFEIVSDQIREEIAHLNEKAASGSDIDDKLADALESLSQNESLIKMLRRQPQPEEKMPEGIRLLKRHAWSIPQSYANDILHTSSEMLAVYPIIDNSMRDNAGNGFSVGDRVFADLSNTDTQNGGIFAVSTKNGVVIRSVDPTASGRGRVLICRALNTLYPAFEISPEVSTRVVGRIVAYVRPL